MNICIRNELWRIYTLRSEHVLKLAVKYPKGFILEVKVWKTKKGQNLGPRQTTARKESRLKVSNQNNYFFSINLIVKKT